MKNNQIKSNPTNIHPKVFFRGNQRQNSNIFPSSFSFLSPHIKVKLTLPQLEELTEIFNAAKPVRYSLKKSEVVIHGNEGVTEVLEKGDLE